MGAPSAFRATGIQIHFYGRHQVPKFLEKKLQSEYGEKSSIPNMVMNSQGLMHGSKETAKGAEVERKHDEAKKFPRYM